MFVKLFYPSSCAVPQWRKETPSPSHGAAQYAADIKTSYATWFENTKEEKIQKIIVWSDQPRGNHDLLHTIDLQGGGESGFILISVSTKPGAPTGWTSRRQFTPETGELHLCFRLQDRVRLYPRAMFVKISTLSWWEQLFYSWLRLFF
ncbi:MAG: hypothetical protein U1F76_06760 [Candidatus Competibacteraceae bacterium]